MSSLESNRKSLIARLESQKKWLGWELAAEKDQIQKELGPFRKLGVFRVNRIEPGIYGRQRIRLAPTVSLKTTSRFLERMLTPGALLLLKPLQESSPQAADPFLIEEVEEGAFWVSTSAEREISEGEEFRLEPTGNPWVASHLEERLSQIIHDLESYPKTDELTPVMALLLGAPFKPSRNPWIPKQDPLLNASQNEALNRVSELTPLSLVQGPPGTGKTTTLASLVHSLTSQGKRVLIAAPSNLAVDNLVEKCLERGVDCLRIGHPARVHPAVRQSCLDQRLRESSDYRIAVQLRKDARAERLAAKKWTRAKPEPGEKRARFAEARELEDEARRLESVAREKLLDDTPALFCTLHGFLGHWSKKRTWEWGLVDEAAQAMECDVWPLVARVENLVLAGDPAQLPPTVLSREAQKSGANLSLMERLAGEYPERLLPLKTQYRMAGPIMEFPSWDRYGGALEAPTEVLERSLSSLSGLLGWIGASPVLAIDTSGSGWSEETRETDPSIANKGESELVATLARRLIQAGLPPESIGIITPYRAQAETIEGEPGLEGVEIDSVDRFQGREKEAILVSLTRSNQQGQIGFLAETRRTHVAITRARSFLAVVGDLSTLASDPYYQRLFDHWLEKGFLKSVWDEEVASLLSQ